MPPRNGFALFAPFPIPKNAAELRFLRMLSLLWVVRLGIVAGGLAILLYATGVL